MAYTIWEMPTFSNNGDTLKTCITDLNTKLKDLGLIDYLGTNESNITNIYVGSASISGHSSMKLMELNYKLPVGNGKTIFEDALDGDYKIITNESYDSTEVYIRIEFYVNSATNSGYSYNIENSSKVFYYTNMVYVSGTPEFTSNNLIDNTTISSSLGGTPYTTMYSTQGTRFCVINLTGSCFSIIWNDRIVHNADFNALYTWPFTQLPQLFFTIYRENGVISCNTRKAIQNNIYMHNDQSTPQGYSNINFFNLALYEIYVEKNTNISYINKNAIEYAKRFPENVPVISEGNLSVAPVYANLINDMKINPNICRVYIDSPNMPSSNQAVPRPIYTQYKGERVKFKYYNASLIFHKLKSRKDLATNSGTIANKECCYFIQIEDYPVTTESL